MSVLSCAYAATVSAGRDFGMVYYVETMICRGCRELVDVLIGVHGCEGPTGNQRFDRELYICHLCRGKKITVWPDDQPCPKCGSGMVIDKDSSPLLWD